MMKAMGGGKARGPMAGLARMMGMGGGMPSPEEMAKLAEKMPGGLPPGMPGLPPTMPGGSGLPGLGKFPGLGGGGKLPTPGGLPADFFKKK
jgi:signal recognition particle subunit SRP54